MLNALTLAGVLAVQAPTEAPAVPVVRPSGPRPLPLTLAYFGETAAHPGGMLGTERTVWQSGWHQAVVGANLGGYRHVGNHTGLFTNAEVGYRLMFPSGLSLELNGGLGYLHTILDGTVYTAGADGTPVISGDWGRPALMPSTALGVGYGLDEGTRLFARLQVFGQYPYNLATLPHMATQVGVTWGLR